MTEFLFSRARVGGPARRVVVLLALSLLAPLAPAQTRATTAPNTADFILAVVNQELVTNAELQSRLARIRDDAKRANQTPPAPAEP